MPDDENKTFEAVDYKTVKVTINTPQVVFVDVEALQNDVDSEENIIQNLKTEFENKTAQHQALKKGYQDQIDEVTAKVVLPPAPDGQ